MPTLDSLETKLDDLSKKADQATTLKKWIIAHVWIAAVIILIGGYLIGKL